MPRANRASKRGIFLGRCASNVRDKGVLHFVGELGSGLKQGWLGMHLYIYSWLGVMTQYVLCKCAMHIIYTFMGLGIDSKHAYIE